MTFNVHFVRARFYFVRKNVFEFLLKEEITSSLFYTKGPKAKRRKRQSCPLVLGFIYLVKGSQNPTS